MESLNSNNFLFRGLGYQRKVSFGKLIIVINTITETTCSHKWISIIVSKIYVKI